MREPNKDRSFAPDFLSPFVIIHRASSTLSAAWEFDGITDFCRLAVMLCYDISGQFRRDA